MTVLTVGPPGYTKDMGERVSIEWTVEVSSDHWVVRDGVGGSWTEPVGVDHLAEVQALLGKVLGVEVAEHHILAAHGEGLFDGLMGDEEQWAQRLTTLLEQADRLRVIIEEWPEGHMMMSRTELKTRAWNDAIIEELLSPAAILPNPHYASGGPMVLFDTRRVLQAERSTAWIQATARLRSQRIVRRWQSTASRAVRRRAFEVAAIDPAEHGTELVSLAISVDAEAVAVREVALDSLARHWVGQEWSVADLDSPGSAPFAALLGDEAVMNAAVGHRDALVARAAAHRVLAALAG